MYEFSRSMFEFVMRLLFRLEISGREYVPEPPFLVAANHNSNIDPAVVGVACKRCRVDFMAKKEIFDMPLLGAWTRSVGGIPVHRGDNSVQAVKEALRRVKQGRVVGLFPEGTRSTDGNLREAKAGSGFLVKKAGVPILPIYIFGTGEAWPKGKPLKPGGRIGAVVGRPILPGELPEKSVNRKDIYNDSAKFVMSRIAYLRRMYESGDAMMGRI